MKLNCRTNRKHFIVFCQFWKLSAWLVYIWLQAYYIPLTQCLQVAPTKGLDVRNLTLVITKRLFWPLILDNNIICNFKKKRNAHALVSHFTIVHHILNHRAIDLSSNEDAQYWFIYDLFKVYCATYLFCFKIWKQNLKPLEHAMMCFNSQRYSKFNNLHLEIGKEFPNGFQKLFFCPPGKVLAIIQIISLQVLFMDWKSIN